MIKNGLAVLLAPGAIVVVVNGCSSSSSGGAGSPADAAPDTAPFVIHRSDASPPGTVVDSGDDGGGDGSLVPDMTTGKACTMNSDCTTTGNNACTNSLGLTVQLWPSPICIPVPATGGNCDPGTDGRIHFCDGPDATTSPGVCVALSNPPSTGYGLCFPKCSFPLNGTAPTGCVAKDTCNPLEFRLGTAGVTGYGFCQGTCQSDADCSALGAGWLCQQDTGFCTMTKATVQPVGTPCTIPDDGGTSACNCIGNASAGYCTSACVVGGASCPTGYVCDSGIPATLNFGTTSRPGPSAQNVGLAGVCLQSCAASDGGVPEASVASEGGPTGEGGAVSEAGGSMESGAATDASAARGGSGCAAGLTCQAGSVAGPSCQ